MSECSVKGRRISDGVWEHIAPPTKKVKWKYDGIFSLLMYYSGEESEPLHTLSKQEAVETARQSMDTKKYQDVLVVQYGGVDVEFNPCYNKIIWHNDRWTNRITTHELYGE